MKAYRALGYDSYSDYLLTPDCKANARTLQIFQLIVCNVFVFCVFRKKVVRRVRRLNPLTNTRAMLRLNPYAAVVKRQAILAAQKRKLAREEELAKKRGVR